MVIFILKHRIGLGKTKLLYKGKSPSIRKHPDSVSGRPQVSKKENSHVHAIVRLD